MDLDIRKYLFSQRAINEWNKLSTDCVTASSVNIFRNKVDNLSRAMKNIGLSINQCRPCPLAIWAFAILLNYTEYIIDNTVMHC